MQARQSVEAFARRRIAVTGAASGMGQATAETLADQGAQVVSLDIREPSNPVGPFIGVDLRKPDSIEAALTRLTEEDLHGLVNCAGLPQTFPHGDVLACNFAGLRALTEAVIPVLPEGGAIVNVSSIVGRPWRKHADVLAELLKTSSMPAALEWIDAQRDLGDPYVFSKMAVNLYTLQRSVTLASRGIRMNAVSPGNTSTQMSAHFERVAGPEVLAAMASVAGAPATPQQQANVIVFLMSDLASYVNGVVLDVDGGFNAALDTAQLPASRPQ